MSEFFTLQAMSIYEYISVILALTSIYLLTYQNKNGFLFSFVSSFIGIFLYFKAHIYMESLLALFYSVLALISYHNWQRKDDMYIMSLSISFHFKLSLILIILTLCIGFYLQHNTKASYPYLDALTSIFAIATTFLLCFKVLENWYYWLVIDLLTFYLYFLKGFYLTAGLYLILAVMAISGLIKWRHNFNKINSYS